MAIGGGGGSGGVRAGAAFVELFVKDAKLRSGLTAASNTLKGFAAGMATVGAGLIGVGATAGAALAGVFAAASSRNTQFYRLSQQLGDTTEALSAFSYAAETTGQDLDRILDDFENWPERLTEAATGAGEAADAFRTIGLRADDLKAMAKLPLTEQMIALAGALSKVTNESQRLTILGKMFSDKGQGFNELFKMGPDGIRKLMAEAGQVGAVVTSANAKAAAEVTGAWSKAWAAVKYAVLSVGDVMLDNSAADKALADQLARMAVRAREWLAVNRELVTILGASAAGAVALGMALVAAAVPVRALGSLLVPVYSGLRLVAATIAGPTLAAFTALRSVAVATGAGLSAFTSSLAATRVLLPAVAAAASTSLAVVQAAAAGTPAAFAAASGAVSAAAATFAAVRGGVVALAATLTAANAKWVAHAAVTVAAQAVMGAVSVALLGVQKAWRGFVAAMLAAEAAVTAVSAGIAALPGLAVAAVGVVKAAWVAGTAALVVAVETVFATWAVFQAAWVAGTAVLSATWAAFVGVYHATGATLNALPGMMSAAWGVGLSAMTVAWSGFVGLVEIGEAVMTGGLAVFAAVVGSLPIILAAAGAAFLAFTDTGRGFLSAVGGKLGGVFSPMVGDFNTAWGGISAAMKSGDLEGAFGVATAFLELEWVRIANFLEETWDETVMRVEEAWAAGTAWLSRQWSAFVEQLTTEWNMAVDHVTDLWDWVAGTWFGKAVGGMAAVAWKVVKVVWSAFEWAGTQIVAVFEWVADKVGKIFGWIGRRISDVTGAVGDLLAWTGIWKSNPEADKKKEEERAERDKGRVEALAAQEKKNEEELNKIKTENDQHRASNRAAAQERLAALQKNLDDKAAAITNKNVLDAGWEAVMADIAATEKQAFGGGGNELTAVAGKAEAVVRAAYGGDASLGFFGGAGSPFAKLETKAGETNSLLEKILKAVTETRLEVNPVTGNLTFGPGK